ncbi:hypothetical protein Ciccas_004629 [Cichlidogyrus casuarinus]|uniref:Uncharacterized protein n=1 Tax=Cichlidogyrus casuarinus TaxID=1844966 RepID=A0ABD2QBU9_9PLAT
MAIASLRHKSRDSSFARSIFVPFKGSDSNTAFHELKRESNSAITLGGLAARILAEIVLQGAKVVGRALGKAISEEILASQQAAKSRRATTGGSPNNDSSDFSGSDSKFGMTLNEAKLILNVKDIKDIETLQKNYDHLFSVNDKSQGGSLYLQSKVFRAKERITDELRDTDPPNNEDEQISA